MKIWSGRIWRLTLTYAHGVCNLLGPDRIHLIADVYADDAYRHFARRPTLYSNSAEPLPVADPAVTAERLQVARGIADLGYGDAAERVLLRRFYCRVGLPVPVLPLPHRSPLRSRAVCTQLSEGRAKSAAGSAGLEQKQDDTRENYLITTDPAGMRVCPEADDHRWPDDGRGQGCPFCAGHRISSTNRLSSLYPEDIARLDAQSSSITADELSVGSSRVVLWFCDIDPTQHPSFPRSVNAFTGGKKGNGTKTCPRCRLVGTSVQELLLKAELATVLRIDPDCDQVLDTEGRPARVDIVAVDEHGNPFLVLEFDGVWWHKGKEDKDAAKAVRLRAAGPAVVRIREAHLEPLDPRFDVVVGFLAAAEDVAADVLDHLARLGLVAQAEADRYRENSFAGPQNRALAKQWIRDRLGEAALRIERNLHKERWARMHAALVDYEAVKGDCHPSDQEVRVAGVSLARWVRKQRALAATCRLDPERARRLSDIPSWSTENAFDASFRRQFGRYRAAVLDEAGTEDSAMEAREATVWANNLRTTRKRLIDQGADLPAWKLDALGSLPGWRWDPFEEQFLSKVVILQDFAAATQRSVGSIKQREQWNGHRIGTMVNSFRTRRATYDAERRAALEVLPGWAWTPREDAWNATLDELRVWAAEHDRMPQPHAADGTEKRLGAWKRNNKNKRKGRIGDDQAVKLRTLLAKYGEHMP
ncbi:helicase associated domain-containing protein [Streptomyces cinereoruber]|uniref:helicase associated domain-containing protein n=1 Tax=Streptomyces cinereoruber TaxID=67260 RepID=UPI0036390BB4